MDNKLIKVYIVGGDRSYAELFLDEIKIVKDIKDANVVLFTGGEDVHPDFYGEDVGRLTNTNKKRDNVELALFKEARKYNKLCVGLCRGSQLLTVLSGGGLIQHVSNHAKSGTHKIHLINEGVDIDITSTHHQMMYPFWLNKKEYDIIAKSTKDLSTTYLDGNDRERRLPPDFVECEIVYYKTTNCLCIQGHPEYMPKDSSAVKYINVLIREYLEDTVETTPNIIEEDIEAPNVDDGILRQVINGEARQINWDAFRGQLNAGEVQAMPNQAARARVNEILNDVDINWA